MRSTKTRTKTKSAPRPSVRDEQRLLTRNRIIAAARELFAERTYIAVSVDDIAAVAGVGRATFYLHFSGKEDVLRSLLAQDLERQSTLFGMLANMAEPSHEELKRWIERYFAGYRKRRDSVQLFNFIMGLDPRYVALFGERRDEQIELLGERLPAFRLPPAGPEREARRVAIHMLLYQLGQLAFNLAFPGSTLDHDAAVDVAAHAVESFLKAAPSAES
ncbi:MAG: TetR/AcrR family transcriptional regulator [Caulobacteraceae bacterium]|nr:TetR/AcrR family transcriptional regulator [Caulobacteraceae bacterium]